MRATVLLVEDESSIADNVVYVLRTEGFEPLWTMLGQEALALLRQRPVDLVILDIGLPDGSGIEICKAIRLFSQVPVVFLTSRTGEIDKVVGLEIGADDYVVKPFSPRELVARIKAILKRTRLAPAPTLQSALTTACGRLVIDAGRAKIAFAGVPLELTRYEYLLLKFLIGHPERVFSRAELMEQVWGSAETSLERTVDAHIKAIRAKLREVAPEPDPLETHRGLGYSLKP